MDAKDYEQLLSDLVKLYKDKGFLGDYFDQLKELQDEQNPKFVSETIKQSSANIDGFIAEITTILKEPEVNYEQLKYFADRVYQSNLPFGGSLVHNSSLKLVAAVDAKSKAECLQSFEVLNRDLETLKEKLSNIANMEDAIYHKKHGYKKLF